MLKALAEGVIDLFLPRHCAVSGRPLLDDDAGPVAAEVLRRAELVGADYCTRCGAPQGAGVGVIGECLSCREVRDGFGTREIVAAGRYAGVLEDMCLALKFGGAREVARPLSAWLTPLLIERGIADKIDAVVPVPLSALRTLQRGYNQAELIAGGLGLGKPVLNALRRMRPTDRQAMLSLAQRRRNVEGVFKARKPAVIEGKTLLLVDDVMTSGATFAEAARTLKRAGAKAVYGAIAARAALGEDS
ncbi:MAG: ComF family protein [Planctomycetes bacterium]|nr:ComF family protein [Planctomycetota bacterium]MCW8135074.1 ComF family protein [Planctomycetota bacterium]